jgi:hypothetical protein
MASSAARSASDSSPDDLWNPVAQLRALADGWLGKGADGPQGPFMPREEHDKTVLKLESALHVALEAAAAASAEAAAARAAAAAQGEEIAVLRRRLEAVEQTQLPRQPAAAACGGAWTTPSPSPPPEPPAAADHGGVWGAPPSPPPPATMPTVGCSRASAAPVAPAAADRGGVWRAPPSPSPPVALPAGPVLADPETARAMLQLETVVPAGDDVAPEAATTALLAAAAVAGGFGDAAFVDAAQEPSGVGGGFGGPPLRTLRFTLRSRQQCVQLFRAKRRLLGEGRCARLDQQLTPEQLERRAALRACASFRAEEARGAARREAGHRSGMRAVDAWTAASWGVPAAPALPAPPDAPA